MGESGAMSDGRTFWVGAALWGWTGWRGEFYPPGTKQGYFLKAYGQRMGAVEGNTVFHALPSIGTVSGWAEVMAESDAFRFCPKLHKEITHGGHMGTDLGFEAAGDFLVRMQPFRDAGVLGPMMIQLPPKFAPHDTRKLERFLRWWPTCDYPLSVELRNLGWWKEPYANELRELLGSLAIGRVLLDTRPLYEGNRSWMWDLGEDAGPSRGKKPEVPMVPEVTARHVIVRYISNPRRDENLPYWEEWAERVAGWLERGLDVTFFMHCPEEDRTMEYTRDFHRILEQTGVELPVLPWDTAPAPPTQVGLF